MSGRRIRARTRALTGAVGLVGAVLLAAAILSCGDDPAVAPLVATGAADIELRLGGGDGGGVGGGAPAPAAGAAPSAGACGPVASGFPEELAVRLTVTSALGTDIELNRAVPAGAAAVSISVEGLAPGRGYSFDVEVSGAPDGAHAGEVLFAGALGEQTISSGRRQLISIQLAPVGRRAVLGVGSIVSMEGSGGAQVVSIFLNNSLPLRGLQFDVCFNDTTHAAASLTKAARLASSSFAVAPAAPAPGSPLTVLVWSQDGGARIAPGHEPVVELVLERRAGAAPSAGTTLVFTDAIVTDSPDPAQNFEVYFLDGNVVP